MLDSSFVNSGSQLDSTQSPDRSRNILVDRSSPKQKWMLTPESFNGMLLWLNSDPNEAGKKYEEIRSALIKRFRQLRSRSEPEELTKTAGDRLNIRRTSRALLFLCRIFCLQRGSAEAYSNAVTDYRFSAPAPAKCGGSI